MFSYIPTYLLLLLLYEFRWMETISGIASGFVKSENENEAIHFNKLKMLLND